MLSKEHYENFYGAIPKNYYDFNPIFEKAKTITGGESRLTWLFKESSKICEYSQLNQSRLNRELPLYKVWNNSGLR